MPVPVSEITSLFSFNSTSGINVFNSVFEIKIISFIVDSEIKVLKSF